MTNEIYQIHMCNENVHGLIRIYSNLANRGAVTKEIINKAIEKGEYSFNSTSDITLHYTQQDKLEISKKQISMFNLFDLHYSYNLSDLLDFRSRALLIVNSEKDSDGMSFYFSITFYSPQLQRVSSRL